MRTVTKKMASATIYALDANKEFEIDESGIPQANVVLSVDGAPTDNKARLLVERHCGHKNVMVLRVDVDESKLSIDPDIFYAHSSLCIDGESYGFDYVTKEFVVTEAQGVYMRDGVLTPYRREFVGQYSSSKLLKEVRESVAPNAVITAHYENTERRFMKREDFLALAR